MTKETGGVGESGAEKATETGGVDGRVGAENHYVLVIHGTGAAPKPDEIKWYQFDPDDESNFCRRLDAALGELGWPAAVWRRPRGMDDDGRRLRFSWSGGNSHADRLAGGGELDELLRRIREADPRCRIHLVAHSHGGNVVLAGLHSYLGWMRHLAGSEVQGQGADAGLAAWRRGLDPEFNRLGRLVFLGTPFYAKCWLGGASWLSRALDAGRSLLVNLLFCFGVVYLLVVGMAGLVGLLPSLGFIGWLPWKWPWAVIAAWLVPAALATWGSSQEQRRRDVNLYFPGFLGVGQALLDEGKARPLESLVVSAGYLDEALLVLSAQPLASAFLVPSMRQAVQPRWWRWLNPVPAGSRNEAPERLMRTLGGALLVVLNVVLLPWNLLRKLLAGPLGAWLTDKTRTALASAALGLPNWELEDARIEVRARLDRVPGVLDSVSWEIEGRLAAEEPPRRSHQPARRYPFLCDEAELDEELSRSQVWRRVERELPAVLRRLGALEEPDQQARRRRLQRICLTLEARGRDLVESIELLHSAYYARPDFARAIALFLATGEAPADDSS